MIIETTVNISTAVEKELLCVSRMTGRTRSAIIVILIKKLMKDHNSFLRDNRRIQYQSRCDDPRWSQVHCAFFIRDYELLLDMRKLCKRSVSFLIAIAVERYLKMLVDEYTGGNISILESDNNLFNQYLLIKEIVDDVICWKIFWGLPYDHYRIFQ